MLMRLTLTGLVKTIAFRYIV